MGRHLRLADDDHLVVRHTRTDEEAGRLELVGSARVGRDAGLAAALLTAAAPSLAIAVLLRLSLVRRTALIDSIGRRRSLLARPSLGSPPWRPS